jgi:hypothetical protein
VLLVGVCAVPSQNDKTSGSTASKTVCVFTAINRLKPDIYIPSALPAPELRFVLRASETIKTMM